MNDNCPVCGYRIDNYDLEGNSGGVAVPYDLVGIIGFPEPMTEKEADEWLDDEQLLQYTDTVIDSDLTAEDMLGEIR